MSSGTKHDNDKVRMELLPPEAILEIAKVFTFGAKKYGDWNWAKGLSYARVLGAMLRHTFAYLGGETLDPETGISHMAHVACGCMFLLHYERHNEELDDRKNSDVE